ncbi:hypothetical protein SDJN02_25718, partial [Cucurbita argyrosperma subsp. argyrosperma]
ASFFFSIIRFQALFFGSRNVIGMENKFVRASEAVIVDSDLLKKKLEVLLFQNDASLLGVVKLVQQLFPVGDLMGISSWLESNQSAITATRAVQALSPEARSLL